MDRVIMADLHAWRASPVRKPLVLEGARQVGKTWCLQEFGRGYDSMAYVNFEADPSLANLFEGDLSITRILAGLSAATGVTIEAGKTLVVLDEIQEVPRALTSLKYFAEQASDQHVAAAGSLLGVTLHAGASFPVGKVDFLTVRPLSSVEFAQAVGQSGLVAELERGDWDVVNALHGRLVDVLRDYLCVGGMPEAVSRFVQTRDYGVARGVQESILTAYERDFSKHAPTADVPRIAAVWHSLPSHLARSNGRFVYGTVEPGARGRQYEAALLWLQQAGLVHPVRLLKAPRLPLAAYEDSRAFKLYAVDTGLMTALSGLDVRAILEPNRLFTEFKGALTEQYAAQEIVAATGRLPHYWTSGPGGAEVDFVVQNGNEIVPIEVKAERNLRSKSLAAYKQKYNPPVAVRASLSPYAARGSLIDLPLYGLGQLATVVAETSQDRPKG